MCIWGGGEHKHSVSRSDRSQNALLPRLTSPTLSPIEPTNHFLTSHAHLYLPALASPESNVHLQSIFQGCRRLGSLVGRVSSAS